MPRKWTTVSITTKVAQRIDEIIKQTGLWPNRSAFVQDAVLRMIREEEKRLGAKPRPDSRGGENCPAPTREREVSTLPVGEGSGRNRPVNNGPKKR
ncbi:MAG: hypothetical protein JRD89_01345 [Deltaproteobacteria bacterium]|nr:hypothetical protein [Deltaproteobacteria bacterium]